MLLRALCRWPSRRRAFLPRRVAYQPRQSSHRHRHPHPRLRNDASKLLLEEFQRTYALPDDKVVKRVPPPYVPGRLAFYRVHDAEQARIIPEGPEFMLFRWDQRTPNPLPADWPREGRLSEAEIGWVGGKGQEVAYLVESFTGIHPYEMQGDQQLMQTGVSGDWVIRDGVAPKKLLQELQAALRTECRLPIRFRLVQKDCQVIVATGQYTFQPLPGNADYTDEAFLPWDRVDVYEKDRSTIVEEGGGTLDDVFDIVARFINRPVVNEVSQLPQNFVCWHWSARRYHEAQARGRRRASDSEARPRADWLDLYREDPPRARSSR